jgi:hypothetical protein
MQTIRHDMSSVLVELRQLRGEDPQGEHVELLRNYLEQSEAYAGSVYEESVHDMDETSDEIEVHVRGMSRGWCPIKIATSATIADLKDKVPDTQGWPSHDLRLLLAVSESCIKGVKDDATLLASGVKDQAKLEMTVRGRPSDPNPSPDFMDMFEHINRGNPPSWPRFRGG